MLPASSLGGYLPSKGGSLSSAVNHMKSMYVSIAVQAKTNLRHLPSFWGWGDWNEEASGGRCCGVSGNVAVLALYSA